jgi:hypothetical protein
MLTAFPNIAKELFGLDKEIQRNMTIWSTCLRFSLFWGQNINAWDVRFSQKIKAKVRLIKTPRIKNKMIGFNR